MSRQIAKTIPKVVQIAVSDSSLFALDEYGNIWLQFYNSAGKDWFKISELPEVNTPITTAASPSLNQDDGGENASDVHSIGRKI